MTRRKIRLKAAAVADQEDRVRELVNHQLMHAELLRKSQKFNRVTSSLDLIGDTGLAIGTLGDEPPSEDGSNYMLVHGLYQSCANMLDACRVIADQVGTKFPKSLVEQAQAIQDIRVRVTGHPHSAKGDPTVGRKGGSYNIGRYGLSGEGFPLHSWHDDDTTDIVGVNNLEVAFRTLDVTNRALKLLYKWFEGRTRELEEKWTALPSSRHLKQALYASEKLMESVRRYSLKPLGKWGLEHLQKCIASIRADKWFVEIYGAELKYELEGVDWTISRLIADIDGDLALALQDEERLVLARYVRDRIFGLVMFCKEVDSAYAPSPEVAFDAD